MLMRLFFSCREVRLQVLSTTMDLMDLTANATNNSKVLDSAPIDIPGQVQKLGDLKADGLITEEEFARKKKELLDKM